MAGPTRRYKSEKVRETIKRHREAPRSLANAKKLAS
jgi:hypothetical protein